MPTTPAPEKPFHGLAEEATATLRECLAAEGLADEAPALLPAFERAVRATVAVVEANVSDDSTRDFALAYLTGRIAKEQVIALQHARNLVNTAQARAEQHWRAALAAERRRVSLQQSSMNGAKQVESF